MSDKIKLSKTLNKKGILLKESAIRVDKVHYVRPNDKLCTYLVYVFKCSGFDCEAEIRLQIQSLKTHTGKCSSCCQKGLPYEASYNELVNSVTNKGTKVEVTLTYEEYVTLCKLPNCHYCLEDLNRMPFSRDNGVEVPTGRRYMLDRMDNSKGYTISNCVPCCWKCNSAKATRYSYEEWYGMTEFLRSKIK